MVKEQHLMEKGCGVMAVTQLEMFKIFGVNNASSFHTNNQKNTFLVLGEGRY